MLSALDFLFAHKQESKQTEKTRGGERSFTSSLSFLEKNIFNGKDGKNLNLE
jgi:hypothetical protein